MVNPNRNYEAKNIHFMFIKPYNLPTLDKQKSGPPNFTLKLKKVTHPCVTSTHKSLILGISLNITVLKLIKTNP